MKVKVTSIEHKGPVWPLPVKSELTLLPVVRDMLDKAFGKDCMVDDGYYRAMKIMIQNAEGRDAFKDKIFLKNVNLALQQCMAQDEDGYLPLAKKVNGDVFTNAEWLKITEKVRARYVELQAEKREYDKAHKEEVQKVKDFMKAKYGYAMVNGEKMEIASFYIEPEGWYFGRNGSKITGTWKLPVEPEDVKITWTKGKGPLPVPREWQGHHWHSIDTSGNCSFIATYQSHKQLLKEKKDAKGWKRPEVVEDLKEFDKKILYKASAGISIQKEQMKYDMYKSFVKSVDDFKKEIEDLDTGAKVLAHLMLLTGIRVGNEADETLYANNTGLSTLRVKHIVSIGGNKYIHLKFVGKDSVTFDNEIEVDEKAVGWLIDRIHDAGKEDFIFSEKDKQEFRNLCHKYKVTPKLLRTYVANETLKVELAKTSKGLKKDSPEFKKEEALNNAFLGVAKKLNHQKGINKKSLDKSKEKMDEYKANTKEKVSELKEKLKALQSKEKKTDKDKERIAKLKERIEKAKTRLEVRESKFDFKKSSASFALGTSKNSYLDPTIVEAWCKKFDYPLEKVYKSSTETKKLILEK